MERVAVSNPGDPFQFYFPNTVTNVFHPLLYHYYHLSFNKRGWKEGILVLFWFVLLEIETELGIEGSRSIFGLDGCSSRGGGFGGNSC